jgi:hypothetical protein
MLGLGVIGLALAALFGRCVVPGVIGHQRDTGAFYYPLTHWFALELQSGRFPLWCPLIFGGYPLLADGEIGMLYPLNVLALLILPTDWAFMLLRTSNYFIAGLGAYALARVLGVGRVAGAYAGLSFALGSFMVGHLDHGNILRSAAWLPALLCCGELALRTTGRRTLLWIAASSACLTLAGLGLHPQILLIDLVTLWSYLPLRAVALWSSSLPCQLEPSGHPATRLCHPERSEGSRSPCSGTGILRCAQDDKENAGPTSHLWRRAARLAAILTSITVLGLVGAAAQIVPTYELGMQSSRGAGVPYANAAAGALSPFDLPTLVLPFLFRADPRSIWSLYPYWETTLYVGAVGLLLALVGLTLGRRRAILPVVGLMLVGLALGMASYFPVDLYGWLWTLPGFSSMRMPGRYSLAIELGLAILAGIGLDRLLAEAGAPRARRVCLFLSGVVALLVVTGLGLRQWLASDEAGSLQAIRDLYLALPHDRVSLSAEQVRGGALAALHWTNFWTVLGLVVLTLTVTLLWKWQQMPEEGRRWQIIVLTLATTELLMVAHAFHPTAPVETLTEASKPMRFLSTRDGLSTQDGLWRTFISGRTDLSITSRPALFGIAQPYGYSSLPTTRMERYWTRVNEVDDELLDLWNSRYVVESKTAAGRMWAHDVLFDPNRPLVDGTPDSPLGQETFGVNPTPTDTIRLISTVSEMADLPDGTVVAELVVSGGDAPPETLTVRLGTHTAEAAYDDQGSPRPIHTRPTVAYHWAPRDPTGRVYPRNLYVGDVTLAGPRQVDRVEVRAIAPYGRLRVVGLALRDRATGGNGSLLPTHRLKYSLVYEDEATAIYENRAVLPRAFVVGEAKVVRPDEWGVLHLLDRGFDPRRRVILERPTPAPEGLAVASPTDGPKTAAVERYESDRVVVHAASSGGGYLVMTDTLFPGWRAWVDGREVPIDRANYLFRSIALPPGEHRVELRFQPWSFYVGATASLLAIAAMIVLAVLGARPTPATSPVRRAAAGTIPDASEQFPPALRGAGAFGGVACIPSESSPETFSKRPS